MNGKIITLEQCNRILQFATNMGLHYEKLEGCLVDSYLIFKNGKKLLKNGRKSKYLILQEIPLNCWNSGIKIIITDNDKKANEFVEKVEQTSCESY